MPDEVKTVSLECLSNDEKIIKIVFNKTITPTKSTAYLIAAIRKCFKHGYYKIIVDMQKIDAPSNHFIAALVESTSKVRRKNGDIKVINLNEEAKQVMAAFNAYYYLSIQSGG